MQPFIHDDFLLETPVARDLYHGYAKGLPIIDFHSHLPPEQVAQNHRFRCLTELWLASDHYKWRAMRTAGIDERYCTGDADDWEKFLAWARVVPQTLRNPLYHWTHLELAFPFGIRDRLLNAETARGIYEWCNERLAEPAFYAGGLLDQYGVVVACTTDDPVDSLAAHRAHQAKPVARARLLPTWRPDRALQIEQGVAFSAWLDRLSDVSGLAVATYDGLLEAVERRHAFFHEAGCRIADHGLETLYTEECSLEEARQIFIKARSGHEVTAGEARAFKSALLYELGLMNHRRGWVQQLHIGPLRNCSSSQFARLGADTGFDAMGDEAIAKPLVRHLDRLERAGGLAKTIVYNLNPRDNELVLTILGCFQGGGVQGKMQFGSAWWFLDQLDGMERQLNALSNLGLLSQFVGMLTDSRSFLSYSRHDYFRRLLCSLLGNDVRRGHLPDDRAMLGDLVAGLCFHNPRRYFGFDET